MKIAIAQLNYIIGDFEGNSIKIIDNIIKAQNDGADLIVFSELSVTGSYPDDLLLKKEFVDKAEETVKKIAGRCLGIAAIVGAPSLKNDALYNSAFFLADGKIQSVHDKKTLCPSRIFNECNYFEPGNEIKPVDYNGEQFIITIGDNVPDEQSESLDFAVNISASLFSHNDDFRRRENLKAVSRKYGLPVINVNQTGAHTGLIFDGGSLFLNEKGDIIKELKYFEEDYTVVDTKDFNKAELQPQVDYVSKIHDALILGIRDYFEKTGFKQAILGLSGGLDSAVATVLAVRALGSENVRVLMLPSKYSSDHSLKDAIELANNLQVRYDILNIQNAVDKFEEELSSLFKDTSFGVAEENIQARARGVYLMAVSNKFGSVLLNATNKSEYAVGYGTLYGDMNGGLAVLGDVYKTEVYKLARFINSKTEIIPENIITKPPSAELRPNQKDTDSLPEYDILDPVLYSLIEENLSEEEVIKKGFERDVVKRISAMLNLSEYKRFQAPPVLRVSTSAFGLDRKMPLLAKY